MGFEPTILAGERPQTHAFDRAATGTGLYSITNVKSIHISVTEWLSQFVTESRTEYQGYSVAMYTRFQYTSHNKLQS